MPEGPTLVILAGEAAKFRGKVVRRVEGNTTRLDAQRMLGRKVLAIRTWGKHFLVEFSGFSLRVHFMLFGSYRIDERKENARPRLGLGFANGEINFYACSVKFIEGPLAEAYDWRGDVMSPEWDPALARRKLRAIPGALASDALLDQEVFAGVGNIIKNEVLFRVRVHPLSTIGELPARKLSELVREAHRYSFQFLEWKRAYVLRKHWLAHRKSTCPRCMQPYRIAHLGRTHRRAFYCENCQVLYGEPPAKVEPLYAQRPRKATSRRKAAPAAEKSVTRRKAPTVGKPAAKVPAKPGAKAARKPGAAKAAKKPLKKAARRAE